MRKALLLLILFVLSPISMAEEKAPSDPRLLQPVTIESTGKRLHSVVDEIAKMTGVTIRCGDNSKDWRVRDIPVAVCTHELPLGVLLQSLADCTHLHLSSEKGVKDVSYRVWRDQKGRNEIAEYVNQVEDYRRARATWGWDVTTRLKDIPQSAFSSSSTHCQETAQMACSPTRRALSELISSLGPSARDRVIAGEALRLDPNTAPEPLRSLIVAYLKAALQAEYERRILNWSPDRSDLKPPSEEDFNASSVSLSFRSRDEAVCTGLQGPYDNTGRFLEGMAAACIEEGHDIPPPPELSKAREIEKEGLRLITNWSDEPALNVKVTLTKPKGKDFITYGDVFAAVSKASGLSIIAEDFTSHIQYQSSEFDFREEGRIGHKLTHSAYHTLYWDEKNRVLLVSSIEWPRRQNNLVPEALLNHLIEKLNGKGVTLDDLIPVAYLTDDQCKEWLVDSLDVRLLQPSPRSVALYQSEQPIVKWYGALNSRDKERLLTEDGLPVSSFAPQFLSDLFTSDEARQVLAKPGESLACSVRIEKTPDFSGKHLSYYVLLQCPNPEWNPKLIEQGKAWIEAAQTELEAAGFDLSEIEFPPKWLPKGGGFLPSPLPIYSKQREEKLLKQQKATTPTPSSPPQ